MIQFKFLNLPKRNSGIVAGKWLQRMRLVNPDTNQYFSAPDFEIGKVVKLNGTPFRLSEATEYALSFMESDPEIFPQTDLVSLVEHLRSAIRQSNADPKTLFNQYADHGRLNIEGLERLFAALGAQISYHEATTIMRRYQTDQQQHTFTLREFLQFSQ